MARDSDVSRCPGCGAWLHLFRIHQGCAVCHQLVAR